MLVVMIGPLLFPIVVAGFVRLLRAPEWRPIRWLAPAMIILLVLTIAGGAQFYYPFGLVAVVYAARLRSRGPVRPAVAGRDRSWSRLRWSGTSRSA